MPFLDVLIRISTNNNIITDIFSKDTDTHMYLNFRSSHPKHIEINIPFNLASRIITITNTEELRDTRLRERVPYNKTINRSKIEMPFLDVLIRISTNNNIITDIFSKDTDTHMYPFNLASRIITITNL
jgi:hypothetical protein